MKVLSWRSRYNNKRWKSFKRYNVILGNTKIMISVINYWKFLAKCYLSTKVAQIFGHYWGYFYNFTFYVQHYCGFLLGFNWNIWVTFETSCHTVIDIRWTRQVHWSAVTFWIGQHRKRGLSSRSELDPDQTGLLGLPLEAGYKIWGHHLLQQPEGQIGS